jgi:hypothetical protein
MAGLENGNLGAACDGADACDYHIDHRVIGDPARGCGKTYEYSYDCGCGVVSGTVEPEASGKDIAIDCAACDPESGSAAACQLELHQHGGFGGWGVTFDNGDYNLASLVGPGPPGAVKHPERFPP